MRTKVGCAALLFGAMGVVTGAAANEGAAGNRGLSPIIVSPIIAQATGSEKVLNGCQDVQTIVKNSAINDFNPSDIVFRHLGYRVVNGMYNVHQSVRDSLKTSVIKAPSHGSLVPLIPNSTNFWTYNGNTGYEGTDKATFLVEVSGKRYKVIVNYLVHEVVDPNAVPPECESVFPSSTAPSGGMTFDPTADEAEFSSWMCIEALSNMDQSMGSVRLIFADAVPTVTKVEGMDKAPVE